MNNIKDVYRIKYKVWIETSDGIGLLGDGKWELLKLINEKESLKAAIEEMGWGYRSTWNKLKKLEDKIGFALIERHRGGTGGGGQTVLTDKGKALINYLENLNKTIDNLLNKPISEFNNKIKDLL